MNLGKLTDIRKRITTLVARAAAAPPEEVLKELRELTDDIIAFVRENDRARGSRLISPVTKAGGPHGEE